MRLRLTFPFFLVMAGSILMPAASHAYIGPGAGLSAIGSLLALLAVIAVAIFGFVWFPLKRMMRKRKRVDSARPAAVEHDGQKK